MPDDLRAFFARYRDAFDRLDGAAVAQLYALPSAIAQAGMTTFWTERAPIVENMVALCALYRERGYAGARYEAGPFIAQGDRYAVADIGWTIAWQGDDAPWHFRTTYNLVRTDDGWRVLLCTAYTEDALHRNEQAG